MKISKFIIILIIVSCILFLFNYNLFNYLLSFIWYIATILIIYSSLKFSKRNKFIQFNLKKIFKSFKTKKNCKVNPLSSLCVSLAAKIGVGSLSGVALCLYYGGIGSIFWLIIFSLFMAINTYMECLLGFECREKIDNKYIGGPSFYINKKLKDKRLGILYSILIILTYGVFFLSIQSNTIVSTLRLFNINDNYIVIMLSLIVLIVLIFGVKGILKINTILVPLMLLFYFILGIDVFIKYYYKMPIIFNKLLKDLLDIKKIFPAIMIGLQKSVFITESSLGTSAISASTCDNDPKNQALLEVSGIYIILFFVCLVTFVIISTSNYDSIEFNNINGIEILIYAFKFHFGNRGIINLSIVTVLFALSTIISSYFFVESNLKIYFGNKFNVIFKLLFLLIVIGSCFINANILWNLCDLFMAFLIIINVSSILKIYKN